MRTAKQKAKEAKEREEASAPESRRKAKEQKEQGVTLALDAIANIHVIVAAKKASEEDTKKVKEAKLVVAMAEAKPFELCGNLLCDEARQPWEKILKVQVMQTPWEDVFGIPHTKTPTKRFSSFRECMRSTFRPCFSLKRIIH